MKQQIPKIIHQTWKSREIPSDYTKWVNSWQQLNPGWEYRLWTDEDNRNFIKENYPDHLHMYDSFPKNIMRVDAIRYYLLYTYGGIYADLDFECVARMDSLVANQTIIIGQEPPEHVQAQKRNRMLCNAWMASVPKHPFWHAVISEIHRRHIEGVDNVMGMTGPILIDEVYEMYSHTMFNDIYVPPVETLYPLLAKMHGGKFRKGNHKVYAVHHWKNSWTHSPAMAKKYDEFSFYPGLDSANEDIHYSANLDEAKEKALRMKDAIAFNTDGWIKNSIPNLKKVWTQDRGIYIKKFPKGFPQIDNYDVYVDQDSPGYDLYRFVTTDMWKLAEIANRDPYVVAFNSDGWFKYRVKNKEDLIRQNMKPFERSLFYGEIPKMALYVKKKFVYPEWARDWDYYPSVDAPGNNVEKISKSFIQPYSDLQKISSLDIFKKDELELTLKKYKEDPSVTAINTDGWCKHYVPPMNEWIFYPPSRYMGLFIKKQKPSDEMDSIEFKNETEEEINPLTVEPQKNIPKIIWQTYKSQASIPREAIGCIATWKKLNPQYEYRFMSDEQMDYFVRKYYPGAIYQMFCDMPIIVMKADIWRILVLYQFGGIYADIDAKCIIPIQHWEKIRSHSFIVSYENDNHHFCNWTMAAAPGHPILKKIIEVMLDRWREGIRYHYEHMVHHHTGPGVVTKGITEFFKVGDMYHKRMKEFKVPQEYTDTVVFYNVDSFTGKYADHLHGSMNWGSHYGSWKKQIKELLKNKDQRGLIQDLEDIYLEHLERKIDTEGLIHYKKKITEEGWSMDQIIHDVQSSSEYKNLQNKKKIFQSLEQKNHFQFISSDLSKLKLQQWFQQINANETQIEQFYDHFIILDKQSLNALQKHLKQSPQTAQLSPQPAQLAQLSPQTAELSHQTAELSPQPADETPEPDNEMTLYDTNFQSENEIKEYN